ncbi:MAG: hypothetical protein U0Q15_19195 [Kineosporiaceae bacterium]
MTARAQGARVEVESARTETSTTWANPDGSMTSEVHGGPIRFRDASGAWQNVDLGLSADAVDGSVTVGRTPGGLRLGKRQTSGSADLISIDAGKDRQGRARGVRWGWTGKLPAPVVSSGEAVYAEVSPGVDVRVRPLRTGFEQFYVLKSRPSGAVSWTVPLTIPGLTARGDGDGGVSFLDDAGAVVSRLLPARAWDAVTDQASGDPVNVSPVALSVKQTGTGRAVLTVTPDAAWLADAGLSSFPCKGG